MLEGRPGQGRVVRDRVKVVRDRVDVVRDRVKVVRDGLGGRQVGLREKAPSDTMS